MASLPSHPHTCSENLRHFRISHAVSFDREAYHCRARFSEERLDLPDKCPFLGHGVSALTVKLMDADIHYLTCGLSYSALLLPRLRRARVRVRALWVKCNNTSFEFDESKRLS
jgi:hypothetical protein